MRQYGRSVMSDFILSVFLVDCLCIWKLWTCKITQILIVNMTVLSWKFFFYFILRYLHNSVAVTKKACEIGIYGWRVIALFTIPLADLIFSLSFLNSKRNIGPCTVHIFKQSMFGEKLVATCFVSLVSECLDYLISPNII